MRLREVGGLPNLQREGDKRLKHTLFTLNLVNEQPYIKKVLR